MERVLEQEPLLEVRNDGPGSELRDAGSLGNEGLSGGHNGFQVVAKNFCSHSRRERIFGAREKPEKDQSLSGEDGRQRRARRRLQDAVGPDGRPAGGQPVDFQGGHTRPNRPVQLLPHLHEFNTDDQFVLLRDRAGVADKQRLIII